MVRTNPRHQHEYAVIKKNPPPESMALIPGVIDPTTNFVEHPEVVAGVADHSRYREDPLGRLSRTSAYVTAASFGAMPEEPGFAPPS